MWLEVLIAVAIGAVIFTGAMRVIRVLAIPAPDEPDPEDVHDVEAAFKCTVCGLRLTVTAAQDGDMNAPRHCREEMVPV